MTFVFDRFVFIWHQVNQKTIELPTNNFVYITNDDEYKDKCTPERIYMNADINQIKENDPIFLDYGKIELVVTKVGEV